MSKRVSKKTRADQWADLSTLIKGELPHFMAWCSDIEGFAEFRLKARDDGTILAIAKGYSSDGGPVVCFGVGYDVVASIIAIDATINGNFWRVDHPWEPKRD